MARRAVKKLFAVIIGTISAAFPLRKEKANIIQKFMTTRKNPIPTRDKKCIPFIRMGIFSKKRKAIIPANKKANPYPRKISAKENRFERRVKRILYAPKRIIGNIPPMMRGFFRNSIFG
jgi:hypothetical protein